VLSLKQRHTKIVWLMTIKLLIFFLPIFADRANFFGSAQQNTSQQKRHPAHQSKQTSAKRSPKHRTNVKRGWSIRRAFIQPVRCTKCKHIHGNVIVILRNGKRLQLTKSGMCHSLQIAPDRRTIGWLEGDHYYDVPPGLFVLEALQEAIEPPRRNKRSPVELYKQEHLADRVESDYLFIWRGGQVLARIDAKYKCIWQFRDGGKRVATSCAVSPARPLENIYTLYDVATGKQLAKWSDVDYRWHEDKTPPPVWARELFKKVFSDDP